MPHTVRETCIHLGVNIESMSATPEQGATERLKGHPGICWQGEEGSEGLALVRAGGVGKEEARGGVLFLLTFHTFTGEDRCNYDYQELEEAGGGEWVRVSRVSWEGKLSKEERRK